MSKAKPNHRQQLVSVEIERRAIMELYGALSNFLVLAKGNGWTCGDLSYMCDATIDECSVRLKKLRKIVRMNYKSVAAKGIDFEIACDEKKVADLSKAFKRARQREIDEGLSEK